MVHKQTNKQTDILILLLYRLGLRPSPPRPVSPVGWVLHLFDFLYLR